MNDSPTHLVSNALMRGGQVVFLTGAGVSAESDVPTFRGREGYWTVGSKVYQPQEMATRAAFSVMPDEVWRWYLYRRTVCRAAVPNAAHHALAELERALGDRFRLVTQNVDGLHVRAGTSPGRTYQMHGNIDFMRCTGAHGGEPVPIPDQVPSVGPGDRFWDQARPLLTCARCGASTRPHVLWFDEYYDEELYRFESSLAAAATASILVTAGTAGATNLPNQMVAVARRQGALVIDINPDDNPFARVAQAAGGLWLQGPAGSEVPHLAELLLAAPA